MGKYEDWVANKVIPSNVSIIELEVFARQLGIDVDGIRDKHLTAIFDELLQAVKAEGIAIRSKAIAA